MLRKLIKYDMRDTYKVTVFMIIINILIFAVCKAAMGMILNGGLRGFAEDEIAGAAFLLFSAYAFLASGVIVAEFIYLMVHYYKTMHGDRAYFSRALPLSTSQLLGGKIISISFFYAAVYFVWFVGYYFIYRDTADILFTTAEYVDEAVQMAEEIQNMTVRRALINTAVSGLTMIPCTVVFCALSFSLGQLMPKNKAAFGVGFFLAISFAIGLIGTMTSLFTVMEDQRGANISFLTTTLETVVVLIISVIVFRLTCRLLDTNVDLE